MINVKTLDAITGRADHHDRKEALIDRLATYAPGQAAPHRLAQLLAQVLHESGGFRRVTEIWGPTEAQRGYEGRKDLGNVRRGDGFMFLGRDLIQITGRANYRSMTRWLRGKLGDGIPDFEERPDLLAHPNWIGTGVIWYWLTRVPQKYVDDGNIEMITRRINGGLHGYSDRLIWYTRSALVLLGYERDDIRAFQVAAGIKVDGISGPVTRAALHKALRERAAVPDVEYVAPASGKPTRPITPIADLLRAILNLFRRV